MTCHERHHAHLTKVQVSHAVYHAEEANKDPTPTKADPSPRAGILASRLHLSGSGGTLAVDLRCDLANRGVAASGSMGPMRLSAYRTNPSYKILCFAETRSGDSFVLLVAQNHPAARGLLDLMGRRIVTHSELKDLWRGAGYGRQGQLPFPSLAEPTLLGDLLNVARALAR